MFLVTGMLPVTGQNTSFIISGQVLNDETEEPVPFAYLHIEELNRTSLSEDDGRFEMRNIPSGTYTLTVHRIGYRTQSRTLQVNDNIKHLEIRLKETVLSSESVEIVGKKNEFSGSALEHASKNIFGTDLRRNLGSTLSQTLSDLPGFDQRTNGSAPARPVIRGLGGERVVILQDGIQTGDISAQSSDHSVTVDPSSADEIEIARGPAALAYGANAIGGVINIVKNQISSTVPSKLNGSFSLSGETVNTGASGAFTLQAPLGDFALKLNASGRFADDSQTPLGTIDNTYFRTTDDGIGVSWVKPWGYVGTSAGIYRSNYGIPPDPQGHPNGVDIEMSKFQYDATSEIVLKSPFLRVLETEFSFKNYNHKEIEGTTQSGRRVIGTEFDLMTTNFNLRTQHNELGFLSQGSIGIMSQFEDYKVEGAGTPPSQSFEIGAYLIEEADFNNLHLEAGLRFDVVHNSTPERGIFYSIGASIGNVDSTLFKNRTFTALSTSFAAIYDLGYGFSTGGNIIHSFRAPSLEELYSEGPHLASYSFDIGNPNLDPERALAKEIFIRFSKSRVNTELTLFHNDFSNYLYAQNTGRRNIQRSDLQDFQFTGTEALLYGTEFSIEFLPIQKIVVQSSLSYTIGERSVSVSEQAASGFTDDKRPLPMIPPFKFKGSIRYTNNKLEFGSRINLAAEQDRTGEFEQPTNGYSVLDAFAQYRVESGRLLHTFSLNVNNIFDETFRDHLSRIKELQPQPGRNISLLYRVYF
ncbi:TonB-dependent receptor [Balneola sp. MJW-20]